MTLILTLMKLIVTLMKLIVTLMKRGESSTIHLVLFSGA